MPDLSFQVTAVEAVAHGLTPLLHFRLRIESYPAEQPIQSVLLHAQIQLQCPQRHYSGDEKANLLDLFGTPERWGQTLRNRLWAHANATFGPFSGSSEAVLPVPCTFDLNIAATKYFYGLESGDVSLLFLFSGSVFYTTPAGHLQVEPISWKKECEYRLPVQTWHDLMERHYPNTGWLVLHRDLLSRLHRFKSQSGLATWDQVMDLLLDSYAEDSQPADFSGNPVTQSQEAPL
jgi:hypothetical protein